MPLDSSRDFNSNSRSCIANEESLKRNVGEQDITRATTTIEMMFALTSTRPEKLHNKLVQSTEYCHFMLAFDSGNNTVKVQHLNTTKPDYVCYDGATGQAPFWLTTWLTKVQHSKCKMP